LRAPGIKHGRQAVPVTLCARLGGQVTLQAQANGEIVAGFGGYAVGLGKFSKVVTDRAQALQKGLQLTSFASRRRTKERQINLLIRRLAQRGFLEYCLRHPQNGEDQIVIEPQTPDYWPRAAQLRDSDVLVLSRFAYMRRRANDMVLESPRSDALFKICEPSAAAVLTALAAPLSVKQLRRQAGFPAIELLGLLADCRILFKLEAAGDQGLRSTEGGDHLALWDFHDLLFHARSTEGRHANPLGGVYPYVGVIPPLPAMRARWPGIKIDLQRFSRAEKTTSQTANLLHERHSTRSFDGLRPITIAELARFLDRTARVQSHLQAAPEPGGDPALTYAARPYPSAGSSYELELYLAVDKCDGLTRGFYHYDAGGHALVPINVPANEFEGLLKGAAFAMGVSAAPQILITIAARFGRVSWKYSSIAYALILKDAGVLTQTFYLMATGMGLGGCAIGIANIERFAKMTGLEFYVEGPIGQFALGRPLQSEAE